MTSLILVASLVMLVLLGSLVGVPIIQQRRLLRTRDHFSGRLLAAQDEERAAIARDLHDDVVQRLLVAGMALRTTSAPPHTNLIEQLDGITRDLRRMAHELHPSAVTHGDLSDALKELIDATEERSGIKVMLESSIGKESLKTPARLALYRIAQESLSNAIKHADAKQITVQLREVDGKIELTIRDQGRGFLQSKRDEDWGLGLSSMKERMALLGGTLSIDSTPGVGTSITALLKA